ncbi:MAG: GTP-binding protein [Alphaproteobacteria bacterium]|nr:GTP-binding protein [Alphaproteobacteria bacterium]
MKKRLPLTVIGGFLGSGKTTLVNHWLRHADGQRLAVLVNDFGALNIDAALIHSNAGNTIELTNGCVCCQIGDDLSMALIGVLESAELFDAVVVEASGVSDPWRIAQLGRADPGLFLDGVIVTANADSLLAHSQDPLLSDTLARQLRAASLIILNHCDLAAPTTISQVRDFIALTAGHTSVFEASHATVPLPMLSGLCLPNPDALSGAAHPHCDAGDHSQSHVHLDSVPSHGDVFETWSCRPKKVFSTIELRDWINAPPPGVLRLKGFVETVSIKGGAAWQEIQFAGRCCSMSTVHSPSIKAAVVAIGLRGHLPSDRLTEFFG